MRVLLLCHGWPPESVGGVEQHVQGLAGALAGLGCQVHVFARTSTAGRPQGSCYLEHDGNPALTRAVYRWEGVGSLDQTYDAPVMAAALQGLLAAASARGERFDVAHVHHLTGLSCGAVAVLQDAGIPVVLTLHDYWLLCPRGQMFHHRGEVCDRIDAARCAECLQLTFPHWLGPGNAAAATALVQQRAAQLLARVQKLVVPSLRVLPPFLAAGVPAGKCTVVENGVDTTALHALPPPPCGPGPLRLGYLGTLIPSKGLHVLVEAVRRQQPGSVALRIFGNAVSYHGDDGYLTRVFEQLRPGDPVSYHGPYQAAELPAILGQIDVVAAPALWHEAFGLTVREGLAAGRPVLVSRIGGLQDAVTDRVQGRVLPPGDVAAWAAAIAELAADRQLVRGLAVHARSRARGFLPMAEELLTVYRDCRA